MGEEPGWGCSGPDSPHPPRAGVRAQAVQVNDSMSGFIGTDVVLHCSFANPLPGVKITQVTWQKATNGTKQNVAIYNPSMGVSVLAPYRQRVEFLRPSFVDGTIRLSRLELEDEGVYICEFATFPAGNRESQLNLTVMGKRGRAVVRGEGQGSGGTGQTRSRSKDRVLLPGACSDHEVDRRGHQPDQPKAPPLRLAPGPTALSTLPPQPSPPTGWKAPRLCSVPGRGRTTRCWWPRARQPTGSPPASCHGRRG